MRRMKLHFLAAMLFVSTGALLAQAPSAAYPAWDVVAVAHRGLSAGFPENTLAAFRSAIAHGAQAIELDLRGTADGEVVVLHDATVDRTTNGRGDVTGMTLREVRALDAGNHAGAAFAGEHVPTYEEVLQLVKGTGVALLLDIKISPVLDKARVVRLTERHGATLSVIVGVRSVADLREFRALNPNLRTLGFMEDVAAIDAFVQAGIDIVRLWPPWIHADPALVTRLQARGKPVWTTAGALPREELSTLIRMGVNGILTDLPEVLAPLLAELRAARR
jgi:glycerophosphoryl diester phosphodiesterase